MTTLEIPYNPGAISANSQTPLILEGNAPTVPGIMNGDRITGASIINTSAAAITINVNGKPYRVAASGPAELVFPGSARLILITNTTAINDGELTLVLKGDAP